MQNLDKITDGQGFLLDVSLWNEAVAQALAAQHGLCLSAEHWEILKALRQFYADYDLSPPMRVLCKFLQQELGKEKASSLYLLRLFPNSPAKLAAQIAGLPKPDNCL